MPENRPVLQGDSGPVHHSGDSGPVHHLGDSGPVHHSGDSGPVHHSGDSGPVHHWGGGGVRLLGGGVLKVGFLTGFLLSHSVQGL